jgi:hypothetical protein
MNWFYSAAGVSGVAAAPSAAASAASAATSASVLAATRDVAIVRTIDFF